MTNRPRLPGSLAVGQLPVVDAVGLARALVEARFPGARLALLAGSSARGTATGTSDLDIVVVLDGPPAPYRETLRESGQLVELFVQTVESVHQFWQREAAERRNTLADMCAHGIVLVGDAEELQREASAFLAAGPPPLTEAELDRRRYLLTDGLDDLGDAVDAGERDVLAGVVLVNAAPAGTARYPGPPAPAPGPRPVVRPAAA